MRYWPERRRQKVGDERRVARDDDVVASTVGGWQTGGFEVGRHLFDFVDTLDESTGRHAHDGAASIRRRLRLHGDVTA